MGEIQQTSGPWGTIGCNDVLAHCIWCWLYRPIILVPTVSQPNKARMCLRGANAHLQHTDKVTQKIGGLCTVVHQDTADRSCSPTAGLQGGQSNFRGALLEVTSKYTRRKPEINQM